MEERVRKRNSCAVGAGSPRPLVLCEGGRVLASEEEAPPWSEKQSFLKF